MVCVQGYDSYIRLFYVISAVVLIAIATTVYVAMVYKEMTKGNVWLQRYASSCANRAESITFGQVHNELTTTATLTHLNAYVPFDVLQLLCCYSNFD